jgi:2-polyprenyl-6-hydroxyphenyl methylase/3-demethylubiquinone-9 3-methyltransferase
MTSSNIDQEELARFEALAPTWWDRNGPFKALHAINGLRVGYVDRRAPLAGKKVLDVGCGGGILAEALAAHGAAVTGIDAGSAPLEVARRHAQQTGLTVHYRKATAEELAEEAAGVFDTVVCMELLEHVPDPAATVAACARLTRCGGDVFFATLNRTPRSFLFAIIGAEYILRLVKPGTHSYRRLIRPAELADWASRAGLAMEDLTGLNYNPFTRAYRLGGSTQVNYLMHFQPQERPSASL